MLLKLNSLAIENLSIAYTNKNNKKDNNNKNNSINSVIENATIELLQGKLTVLLGINGIGKSSLLRVLAGLQTNFTGKVTLFDKNIQSYHLAEIAKYISVVLTEKPQHSYITVKEIVALGRQPHTDWTGKLTKLDDKIIAKCLEITQLTDLENRYLQTLSDGQLQKTLIARALAQASEIMLLDEPTAHLDICNKAEIWNLLKIIAKDEQKAILLTSHDIDFSLQIADVIWLIHEKKLLAFSPEELIKNNLLNLVFKSPHFMFENGQFALQ